MLCGLKFNFAHLHRWDLKYNVCGARKMYLTLDHGIEASISSPSLWRLGILSEQSEEKLEESQETARDVAIAVTMHTWACVWILRGLNLGFILGYLLNYNFSFTIINAILLCFTYQLMLWGESIDKLECSWCFCILTYDFDW